jgi:hypothetical protein
LRVLERGLAHLWPSPGRLVLFEAAVGSTLLALTCSLGFRPWTPGRRIDRRPGAYGQFRTGGSLGFADPRHGIAFGSVMNHTIPR